MLKARDFIVIATLSTILFVFFLLFTPTMHTANYDADSGKVTLKADSFNGSSSGMMNYPPRGGKINQIAVIGDADGDVTKTVTDTLQNMKISFNIYDSFKDINHEETAVITKREISGEETEALKAWLENDKGVIFAEVPLGLTGEIRRLLGIVKHTPIFEAAGFTLYEGIMLKGLKHVGVHKFTSEGIELDSRCKIFATAYSIRLEERIQYIPIRAEYPYKTPMIWRVMHNGGEIYVINSPFMDKTEGSGLLAGILSLRYDDLIYPIVGTKTVGLMNFPYLPNDNMMINSRSSFGYTRDIIWPGMVSVAKNLELSYTCYPNGDFYGGTNANDNIQFMYDELYRLNYSELGCEAEELRMFERNQGFLAEKFTNMEFNSLMNPGFEPKGHVSAVSRSDGFNGFSWVSNRAVNLPVTGTGVDLDVGSFANESYITAFGYSFHAIDMEPIFINQESANEYMQDIGKKLHDYYVNRNYMDSYSAKGAAEEVKNYLNLSTAVSYRHDGTDVVLSGHNRAVKYILRTEKTVDEMNSVGCEITEIYKGVYLVVADGGEFTVSYLPE
ncbi:MAG: DUF2194 domain-containing protein [Lachnospiraceae bacterium]|nr:DUF2194 domain-containing protein [Lachnospiraceae bacterium]